MVNFVILVLLIAHELLEFLAEEVHLSKIKWTEICKKRLVDEIVIDAEIEGVLSRFRWILVTDPV